LGIDFGQQMNMIRHDLRFEDFRVGFVGHVQNNLPGPGVHAIDQDGPAILWTPNDVVFAGVYHVAGRFALTVVALHARSVQQAKKEVKIAGPPHRRTAANPMAKARGLARRNNLVNQGKTFCGK
jgi:hypothetical protein